MGHSSYHALQVKLGRASDQGVDPTRSPTPGPRAWTTGQAPSTRATKAPTPRPRRGPFCNHCNRSVSDFKHPSQLRGQLSIRAAGPRGGEDACSGQHHLGGMAGGRNLHPAKRWSFQREDQRGSSSHRKTAGPHRPPEGSGLSMWPLRAVRRTLFTGNIGHYINTACFALSSPLGN